jgi:trehalose synthase
VPLEIDIPAASTDRFESVLSAEQLESFEQGAAEARRLLEGRCVWNVNSTARGGGVVELLRPLVSYARGLGVDARWIVIDGPPAFFEVTKRIHNRLHGSEGDGLPLDQAAQALYEGVLAENAAEFPGRVQEGDVVILHDPQTAGLVEPMRSRGAAVVWRCHVGLDEPNPLVREAWNFLLPYVREADAYVFSRESFAWDGLDRARVAVIKPSIDAFAPKNRDLEPSAVRAILCATGLVSDPGADGSVAFVRHDGTAGRVERPARLWEESPLAPDVPVVVQVSRWDALKDPLGVVRGFTEHVPADTGAHLLYAGPSVEAVADDPEGERVLRATVDQIEDLPGEPRARIHLAALPMEDAEENAIMVNALQRHARVIVQKSLAEGFGLTVAEAMWKGRPVVASRIGGIQDQIVDGDSGVLLDDPEDLASYGAAVTRLLREPHEADRLGARARERVRDGFLSTRSLLDYLDIVRRVLLDEGARGGSGA